MVNNYDAFVWSVEIREHAWFTEVQVCELEAKWKACEDIVFVGFRRLKQMGEYLYRLEGFAIRKSPSNLNNGWIKKIDGSCPPSHIFYHPFYRTFMLAHYIKEKDFMNRDYFRRYLFKIQTITINDQNQRFERLLVQTFIDHVVSAPNYVEHRKNDPLLESFKTNMTFFSGRENVNAKLCGRIQRRLLQKYNMPNIVCFLWKSYEDENAWKTEWWTRQYERKWLNCEDIIFVGFCREKHPRSDRFRLKGIAIRKNPSKLIERTELRFHGDDPLPYSYYDRYKETTTIVHPVRVRNDRNEHWTESARYKTHNISIGDDIDYFEGDPIRQFIISVIKDPSYVEQGNGDPIIVEFHPNMLVGESDKCHKNVCGFKTMIKINPLIK